MLESFYLESLEQRRHVARRVFLCEILHEGIVMTPEDLGIAKNPRALKGIVTQDKHLVKNI